MYAVLLPHIYARLDVADMTYNVVGCSWDLNYKLQRASLVALHAQVAYIYVAYLCCNAAFTKQQQMNKDSCCCAYLTSYDCCKLLT